MKPKRSKSSSEAFGLPTNVVDLQRYRAKISTPRPPLFFLTSSDKYLSLMQLASPVPIEAIQSTQALRSRLMACDPELVVIEYGLDWGDPMQLIAELDYLLEVPILLLCDIASAKAKPTLIKEAYTAGVHDVLFSPFVQDELKETLQVLFKLQQTARSI